jgi:hypothetical protein
MRTSKGRQAAANAIDASNKIADAAQMRTEPKWPDRFDKVFLGDPTDPKIQNKITSESFDAAVFPIAVDYQNTQIPFQQVLAVNVGLVWEYLTLLHQKLACSYISRHRMCTVHSGPD